MSDLSHSLHPDEIVRDEGTISYFDEHVPEYSLERLDAAIDAINAHTSNQSQSLVDLGCGTGNTLAYISERTGIERLCGVDVSERSLEKTRSRVPCETRAGSILDRRVLAGLDGSFDFAVIAAVLHHLIGKSRSQSRQYAAQAVQNALDLLKPGGHVIVLEPVFYPSWAMDAVFWIKKGVTRLTSRRIELFGQWNNLGQPIVSYYTNEELVQMLGAGNRATVVTKHVEMQRLPPALRPVLHRMDTTIVAQRRDGSQEAASNSS